MLSEKGQRSGGTLESIETKYSTERKDPGGELRTICNLFRSLENYILILALNDRANLGTLKDFVESHFFLTATQND